MYLSGGLVAVHGGHVHVHYDQVDVKRRVPFVKRFEQGNRKGTVLADLE
jgi:hypothetical protein